jgi:hypothetical protein
MSEPFSATQRNDRKLRSYLDREEWSYYKSVVCLSKEYVGTLFTTSQFAS